MTYYIFIIGCQQNVHDGVRLKNLLDSIGCSETSEKKAELIFVIACSVRQRAVDRIFGKLKLWTDKKVFITACVLSSDRKKLADREVVFFDIENLNSLKALLDIDINNDFNILADSERNSPYLPIMSGCNNFCSYCAVPYTRGRETSLPIVKVAVIFQALLAKGHKEITLLGQNVNSYKINRNSRPKADQPLAEKVKSDFAILLRTLNGIPGNFTIKFLTNHPKDMSDDVIQTIATLPKIAKEIHLPLQSGSTRILKLMNRKYTRENYLVLVGKIKKLIPSVQISTDIIVGFPGETETDFKDTVDVVKKVGFLNGYIAMYSPRPGTIAAKMPDNVPLNIKKSRFRVLDNLINDNQKIISFEQ